MIESVAPVALTHGWNGLWFAYLAVQAPMLAGLIHARGQFHRLLLSPAAAVPLAVAANLAMSGASPILQTLGIVNGSVLQLGLGVALSAGCGYLGGRAMARAALPEATHRRGTVIVDAAKTEIDPALPQRVRARVRGIRLAGVEIAGEDEMKHFKIIGTTGTGKSSAIHEILSQAFARGDRAVIADPDGGYRREFFAAERGDSILNPFDPQSAKWDLFGEIRCEYDVEQLARSLIPDHDGPDKSWRSYARTFFTAVTQQAHDAGVTDVAELFRLLVVADTKDLRALVQGTPAQPFLEADNSRMFDSIRSVTSSAVGALRYVAKQHAEPLSVRNWVSAGRSSSNRALFIPYQASQIAALRSTISAWMRLSMFEAMNQSEHDQRLWFVIDELDALGQIDGLKDALARLRKFGGRCVLGFQSVAQVSSTYGQGDAHTIVENCGNTLILRCSASEGGGTARFASQLIGDREIVRTTVARTRGSTQIFGSKTHSQQFSVEAALLPSQIEQLPDLSGYLKRASRPQWLSVQVSPPARATHHVAVNATDTSAKIRGEAVRSWGQQQSKQASHAVVRDGAEHE